MNPLLSLCPSSSVPLKSLFYIVSCDTVIAVDSECQLSVIDLSLSRVTKRVEFKEANVVNISEHINKDTLIASKNGVFNSRVLLNGTVLVDSLFSDVGSRDSDNIVFEISAFESSAIQTLLMSDVGQLSSLLQRGVEIIYPDESIPGSSLLLIGKKQDLISWVDAVLQKSRSLPVHGILSSFRLRLFCSRLSDHTLVSLVYLRDRTLMLGECFRSITMASWPSDLPYVSSSSMSQAGMFYSCDRNDTAKCLCCGVSLIGWVESDVPWTEHLRHTTQCPFIQNKPNPNVPSMDLLTTKTPHAHSFSNENITVIGKSAVQDFVATASAQGNITIWDITVANRIALEFSLQKQLDEHFPGTTLVCVDSVCLLRGFYTCDGDVFRNLPFATKKETISPAGSTLTLLVGCRVKSCDRDEVAATLLSLMVSMHTIEQLVFLMDTKSPMQIEHCVRSRVNNVPHDLFDNILFDYQDEWDWEGSESSQEEMDEFDSGLFFSKMGLAEVMAEYERLRHEHPDKFGDSVDEIDSNTTVRLTNSDTLRRFDRFTRPRRLHESVVVQLFAKETFQHATCVSHLLPFREGDDESGHSMFLLVVQGDSAAHASTRLALFREVLDEGAMKPEDLAAGSCAFNVTFPAGAEISHIDLITEAEECCSREPIASVLFTLKSSCQVYRMDCGRDSCYEAIALASFPPERSVSCLSQFRGTDRLALGLADGSLELYTLMPMSQANARFTGQASWADQHHILPCDTASVPVAPTPIHRMADVTVLRSLFRARASIHGFQAQFSSSNVALGTWTEIDHYNMPFRFNLAHLLGRHLTFKTGEAGNSLAWETREAARQVILLAASHGNSATCWKFRTQSDLLGKQASATEAPLAAGDKADDYFIDLKLPKIEQMASYTLNLVFYPTGSLREVDIFVTMLSRNAATQEATKKQSARPSVDKSVVDSRATIESVAGAGDSFPEAPFTCTGPSGCSLIEKGAEHLLSSTVLKEMHAEILAGPYLANGAAHIDGFHNGFPASACIPMTSLRLLKCRSRLLVFHIAVRPRSSSTLPVPSLDRLVFQIGLSGQTFGSLSNLEAAVAKPLNARAERLTLCTSSQFHASLVGLLADGTFDIIHLKTLQWIVNLFHHDLLQSMNQVVALLTVFTEHLDALLDNLFVMACRAVVKLGHGILSSLMQLESKLTCGGKLPKLRFTEALFEALSFCENGRQAARLQRCVIPAAATSLLELQRSASEALLAHNAKPERFTSTFQLKLIRQLTLDYFHQVQAHPLVSAHRTLSSQHGCDFPVLMCESLFEYQRAPAHDLQDKFAAGLLANELIDVTAHPDCTDWADLLAFLGLLNSSVSDLIKSTNRGSKVKTLASLMLPHSVALERNGLLDAEPLRPKLTSTKTTFSWEGDLVLKDYFDDTLTSFEMHSLESTLKKGYDVIDSNTDASPSPSYDTVPLTLLSGEEAAKSPYAYPLWPSSLEVKVARFVLGGTPELILDYVGDDPADVPPLLLTDLFIPMNPPLQSVSVETVRMDGSRKLIAVSGDIHSTPLVVRDIWPPEPFCKLRYVMSTQLVDSKEDTLRLGSAFGHVTAASCPHAPSSIQSLGHTECEKAVNHLSTVATTLRSELSRIRQELMAQLRGSESVKQLYQSGLRLLHALAWIERTRDRLTGKAPSEDMALDKSRFLLEQLLNHTLQTMSFDRLHGGNPLVLEQTDQAFSDWVSASLTYLPAPLQLLSTPILSELGAELLERSADAATESWWLLFMRNFLLAAEPSTGFNSKSRHVTLFNTMLQLMLHAVKGPSLFLSILQEFVCCIGEQKLRKSRFLLSILIAFCDEHSWVEHLAETKERKMTQEYGKRFRDYQKAQLQLARDKLEGVDQIILSDFPFGLLTIRELREAQWKKKLAMVKQENNEFNFTPRSTEVSKSSDRQLNLHIGIRLRKNLRGHMEIFTMAQNIWQNVVKRLLSGRNCPVPFVCEVCKLVGYLVKTLSDEDLDRFLCEMQLNQLFTRALSSVAANRVIPLSLSSFLLAVTSSLPADYLQLETPTIPPVCNFAQCFPRTQSAFTVETVQNAWNEAWQLMPVKSLRSILQALYSRVTRETASVQVPLFSPSLVHLRISAELNNVIESVLNEDDPSVDQLLELSSLYLQLAGDIPFWDFESSQIMLRPAVVEQLLANFRKMKYTAPELIHLIEHGLRICANHATLLDLQSRDGSVGQFFDFMFEQGGSMGPLTAKYWQAFLLRAEEHRDFVDFLFWRITIILKRGSFAYEGNAVLVNVMLPLLLKRSLSDGACNEELAGEFFKSCVPFLLKCQPLNELGSPDLQCFFASPSHRLMEPHHSMLLLDPSVPGHFAALSSADLTAALLARLLYQTVRYRRPAACVLEANSVTGTLIQCLAKCVCPTSLLESFTVASCISMQTLEAFVTDVFKHSEPETLAEWILLTLLEMGCPADSTGVSGVVYNLFFEILQRGRNVSPPLVFLLVMLHRVMEVRPLAYHLLDFLAGQPLPVELQQSSSEEGKQVEEEYLYHDMDTVGNFDDDLFAFGQSLLWKKATLTTDWLKNSAGTLPITNRKSQELVDFSYCAVVTHSLAEQHRECLLASQVTAKLPLLISHAATEKAQQKVSGVYLMPETENFLEFTVRFPHLIWLQEVLIELMKEDHSIAPSGFTLDFLQEEKGACNHLIGSFGHGGYREHVSAQEKRVINSSSKIVASLPKDYRYGVFTNCIKVRFYRPLNKLWKESLRVLAISSISFLGLPFTSNKILALQSSAKKQEEMVEAYVPSETQAYLLALMNAAMKADRLELLKGIDQRTLCNFLTRLIEIVVKVREPGCRAQARANLLHSVVDALVQDSDSADLSHYVLSREATSSTCAATLVTAERILQNYLEPLLEAKTAVQLLSFFLTFTHWTRFNERETQLRAILVPRLAKRKAGESDGGGGVEPYNLPRQDYPISRTSACTRLFAWILRVAQSGAADELVLRDCFITLLDVGKLFKRTSCDTERRIYIDFLDATAISLLAATQSSTASDQSEKLVATLSSISPKILFQVNCDFPDGNLCNHPIFAAIVALHPPLIERLANLLRDHFRENANLCHIFGAALSTPQALMYAFDHVEELHLAEFCVEAETIFRTLMQTASSATEYVDENCELLHFHFILVDAVLLACQAAPEGKPLFDWMCQKACSTFLKPCIDYFSQTHYSSTGFCLPNSKKLGDIILQLCMKMSHQLLPSPSSGETAAAAYSFADLMQSIVRGLKPDRRLNQFTGSLLNAIVACETVSTEVAIRLSSNSDLVVFNGVLKDDIANANKQIEHILAMPLDARYEKTCFVGTLNSAFVIQLEKPVSQSELTTFVQNVLPFSTSEDQYKFRFCSTQAPQDPSAVGGRIEVLVSGRGSFKEDASVANSSCQAQLRATIANNLLQILLNRASSKAEQSCIPRFALLLFLLLRLPQSVEWYDFFWKCVFAAVTDSADEVAGQNAASTLSEADTMKMVFSSIPLSVFSDQAKFVISVALLDAVTSSLFAFKSKCRMDQYELLCKQCKMNDELPFPLLRAVLTKLSAIPGVEVSAAARNNDPARKQIAATKEPQFWSKGTGYSTGSKESSWNVSKFLASSDKRDQMVTALLRGLQVPCCAATDPNHEACHFTASLLARSSIPSLLMYYFSNDSVQEISSHLSLYSTLIALAHSLVKCPKLRWIFFYDIGALESLDAEVSPDEEDLRDPFVPALARDAVRMHSENVLANLINRMGLAIDLYNDQLEKIGISELTAASSSPVVNRKPKRSRLQRQNAGRGRAFGLHGKAKQSDLILLAGGGQGSTVPFGSPLPWEKMFESVKISSASLDDSQTQSSEEATASAKPASKWDLSLLNMHSFISELGTMANWPLEPCEENATIPMPSVNQQVDDFRKFHQEYRSFMDTFSGAVQHFQSQYKLTQRVLEGDQTDAQGPAQSDDVRLAYTNALQPLQFAMAMIVEKLSASLVKLHAPHHFAEPALKMDGFDGAIESEWPEKDLYVPAVCSSGTSPLTRTMRLTMESITMSTSLPLDWNSSIFLRIDEQHQALMKALIIGPKDTPYQNGCFEFDIFIPPDYPKAPPSFFFRTTGMNTVNFNPNLYSNGKVCLSLLNTWNSRPEERWIPDTSSILQVLVSIQAMIMVSEPYFNEPGYEQERGSSKGTQASEGYNAKTRESCLKWAILDKLTHPPPLFEDVVRTHFRFKRDEIKDQMQIWIKDHEKFSVADLDRMRLIESYIIAELDKLQDVAPVQNN